MKTLLITASLALGACTTAPPIKNLPVLHALASIPVEYRAGVTIDGLKELDDWGSEGEEQTGPAFVQISTTFEVLEMKTGVADQLIPMHESEGIGRLVERAASEGIVERMEEAAVSCNTIVFPRLMTNAGQRGMLTVVNQQAFVSGFEMSMTAQAPRVMVADPVVSVSRDGWALDLVAEASPTGLVTLRLELLMTEPSLPVETTQVRLPGVQTLVEVQTPYFINQGLQAQADLTADQALVLGPWPSVREGYSLVAIATSQVVSVDSMETDLGGPVGQLIFDSPVEWPEGFETIAVRFR